MPVAGFKKITLILFLAVAIKLALILAAGLLTVDVLGAIGVPSGTHTTLISYAPEVWLSLLALVFGTLIIVVSIASENTPKLVDMFIGDAMGRLYIWLIMFSTLENIYLQILSDRPTMFLSNMIFINNYVLLPSFVLLAIPYTFYILKYTKNSNVIAQIYKENIHTIKRCTRKSTAAMERNKRILFSTINQLHDLLQYTQFKEPKGDIISCLGNSIRIYLKFKRRFPPEFFRLGEEQKADISLRTMREKYARMEEERIMYEVKVFKVLDAIYLLLIRESHYELASLCGNELLEIGRVAIRQNDVAVVDEVVFQFNTLLRFGINHALKTREIRNPYNIIYYYNQLIQTFIERKEEDRILTCCLYFVSYARELTKHSQSEPQLGFLVDAISWELKNSLELIHKGSFSRELQARVIKEITTLTFEPESISAAEETHHRGLRLIKESMCLYYFSKNDYAFVDLLIDSILTQMNGTSTARMAELIKRDCEFLQQETENFWEETDQGNRNIYYTREKEQIPGFAEYVVTRLRDTQPDQLDRVKGIGTSR